MSINVYYCSKSLINFSHLLLLSALMQSRYFDAENATVEMHTRYLSLCETVAEFNNLLISKVLRFSSKAISIDLFWHLILNVNDDKKYSADK